jgi:hypothetical protein
MPKGIRTLGLFAAVIVFIWSLGIVRGSVGIVLGKDFFIALPHLAITATSAPAVSIPVNSTINIIISTKNSTNATIFIGTGHDIKVPPFTNSQTVVLPISLIPVGTGVSPLGIHVQTQDLSRVQVTINSPAYGSAGGQVLPMEYLFPKYILNGPLPPNPSFSIIRAEKGVGSVKLGFSNGSTTDFSLGYLEVLHFEGSEYLYTIVESKSGGNIAVFLGRDCTGELAGSCTHLLEQFFIGTIDHASCFHL